MNSFEIIVLLTTVIAVVLSFVGPLRFDHAFRALGRTGSMWFDHAADSSLAELPSEDERDAPIPVRPLRARAR